MKKSVEKFVIKKGVLTKYNGDDKDVVIPEGVTEIFARVFQSSDIRSVTFPSSLKIIGRLAFSNCNSLKQVAIPENIELMRDGVFSDCQNLEKVILPQDIKVIPAAMFYYCPNLRTINFPQSLTKIDGGAFHACYKLTEIRLPDGITEIGPSAFSHCFDLRNVHLPQSLTALGACAFEMCAISEIDIPQGVKYILFNTFEDCENLQKVTLHEGLISIGSHAFGNCKKLEQPRIPDSVEYVDCAFSNTPIIDDFDSDALYLNGHLLKVMPTASGDFEVAEGTKSISDSAFYNCNALMSVRIPSSVKTVGCFAFSDCKNLVIYADFAKEPTTWIKGWNPEKRPVVWLKDDGKQIRYEIDRQKNADFYRDYTPCGCAYCKNYTSQIENVMPELAEFFADLNADIKKPFELMYLENDGKIDYMECQYLLFGTWDCDYEMNIGEIKLSRTDVHPSTRQYGKDCFVLQFSVVLPLLTNMICVKNDGTPQRHRRLH